VASIASVEPVNGLELGWQRPHAFQASFSHIMAGGAFAALVLKVDILWVVVVGLAVCLALFL
jgi:hypothetical protein